VLALEPEADKALDAAERLVIETTDILGGQSASLAVLARPDLLTLPAGKTLGDYVTPDVRTRIEEKLTAYGIPFGSVETLQPWFFSIALLLPPCEAARQADGAEVLDVSLATRAKAAGKPVLGLETAIEQVEAMASLSMDLQVASLLGMLELKPDMPDIFETMIELYLSGDVAMISAVAEAAMPLSEIPAESVAAYTEFENRIVEARNRVMAERLQPILSQGGTFVAVGALHLPGTTGLVELLRKAGYTVTRAD
ncbi:MAG TPA: TraB/GumN family protein, partial [Methylobacterium sp.]